MRSEIRLWEQSLEKVVSEMKGPSHRAQLRIVCIGTPILLGDHLPTYCSCFGFVGGFISHQKTELDSCNG